MDLSKEVAQEMAEDNARDMKALRQWRNLEMALLSVLGNESIQLAPRVRNRYSDLALLARGRAERIEGVWN